MAGLYLSAETDVIGVFDATWPHPTVPVYWRTDDLEPLPDPGTVSNFLRNTVNFDAEETIAFGGGRGLNQKVQYGSVDFIAFAARQLVSEAALLELLADATATVRSKRVTGSYAGGSDLSFIGTGSHFHVDAREMGNWFVRGCRMVWEYRFIG